MASLLTQVLNKAELVSVLVTWSSTTNTLTIPVALLDISSP